MTKSNVIEVQFREDVALLERTFKSKANGDRVTERLYKCANNLWLGARKGGALHLSDGTNWEIFTFADGVPYGEPVGFVSDETLAVAVERLAAWGEVA